MLSVVFPTRGRPVLFADALANLTQTATNCADIQVVVGVDEDDPAREENNRRAGEGLDRFGSSRVLNGSWPTMQAKMEALYAACTGAGVLFFADDCRWETIGWDEQLRRTADHLPGGFGVISVNDCLHANLADYLRENGVPGNFLITRKWADTVGYWWPPGLAWSAQDTWVWDMARRVDESVPGARVVLMGAVCVHYHKRLVDLCTRRGLPIPAAQADTTYNAAADKYDEDVYGLHGYVARTVERYRDADKILAAIRKGA